MKPVGMCRMCLVEVDGRRGSALQPACMINGRRRHGRAHRVAGGEEGAGRRARVPAHQPSARLPGLRPGRRVPAAGPDASPSARARAGSSRRSATSRSRSRSAISSSSTASAASCALAARASPTRSPATRSSSSSSGATRPRSSPSPTIRSRPTSAATPCRSARSARSPPSPTASRPVRGTSSRWSRRAPRARSAAACAVQSSSNRSLRYLGVDSDPVNQGWLCDKGRFDFEAIRLATSGLAAPLVRTTARPSWLEPAAWAEALARGRATGIRQALDRRRSGIGRRARRRPAHQRGRLRVGQAGQGASSAPTTSTPSSATACPPTRRRAAARDHRRSVPGAGSSSCSRPT